MAKDIADVLGIVEDTDFPTGYKIVDGQTFVSAELYQDMIQTFQKMLDLASIVPNGKFDNEVNGYQMLDALYETLRINLLPTRTPSVKKGVAVWATSAEVKEGTNILNYINPLLLKTQTGGYYRKKVNIGSWQMSVLQRVTVPHGLSLTERLTITNISVIIRDDGNVNYYKLERVNADTGFMQGGVEKIDATNITIARSDSPGIFTSSDFDYDLEYNRGFITFDYIPD